jgi:hypothetical protein
MKSYVFDISLISGKNYSTSICSDEWDIIIAECKKSCGNIDGWAVPLEILEELWLPEYLNCIDKIIVRRIN